MPVKSITSVDNMGTPLDVETFMSDYVYIDGVTQTKKTTVMDNSMEDAVILFDNIEINIPMNNSIHNVQ